MTRRSAALPVWFAAAAAISTLTACGPNGTLNGKVSVEGGSSANVAVFIYGPASTATVTKDDGTFSATSLPDGQYVVRAVVKGAEVEDVSVPANIVKSKNDAEVTLNFRFSAGKVTGKVVFADGSDSSGLSVTLSGGVSRGTRTAAGGTFSFEGVPPGAYIAAVEAQDTAEGRVGVGVAVTTASVDTGELRLTPIGRIAGVVTANSMPIAGATVSVAGTALSATTDALGKFSLSGVPAGDQSFVARTAVPPRVATQAVTVARGANTDLAIALMEDTRRGTVNGSVTFVGQQSPKLISVTVPGTAATATPAANGVYTMQVPAGDWDVVASAPYHPKKIIGRVHVIEGQTSTLPGEVLSWYEPVWETTQTITSITTPVQAPTPSTWFWVTETDATGVRTMLINRATKDVRVIAAATITNAQWSANGKYLGFMIGAQLFTYEVATADLKAWGVGLDPSVNYFRFSTDETVLFVARYTAVPTTPGYFLERIPLATGVITRFPSSGVAAAVYPVTNDRHLWAPLLTGTITTYDVNLVTTTNDYPNVFTQVYSLGSLYTSPTPIALTNCSGTPLVCTPRLLAPTATSAVTVNTSLTFGTTFTSRGGTGDWPWVLSTSGTYLIIRSSDGAGFPLPTGASFIYYNQTTTRFMYLTSQTSGTPSVTTQQLREDVFPPSPSPSPVTQVSTPTSFIDWSYITPTRLVAVDYNNTTFQTRIYDIKSGVMTTEFDTPSSTGPTLGSYSITGGMVAWPSAGTSKWKVLIGDKPTTTVDVPYTTTYYTGRARLWVSTAPAQDVGAISFEQGSAYVIDANQTVKRSFAGYVNTAERFGTAEMWLASRLGNGLAIVPFGSDQYVDVVDPALSLTRVSVGPTERTYFGLAANRIVMGWMR